MRCPTLTSLILGLLTPSLSPAAETVRYQRDVRPILASKCWACHGPDATARQAELRLDLRESAIVARDGKAAVIPGKPQDSELIRRIESTDPEQQMPPPASHQQLTPTQRQTLKQWIAEGAAYEPHWAFVRPHQRTLPVVSRPEWVRTPIDRWVLAKLDQLELDPSPEADRYTLARRVSLDLVGLLPSAGDVETFVNDSDPQAYEKFVDRLLASPSYGERWGRRWLDLARYADTNGYEKDRPRTIWPYRDWVIQALSEDRPFDQFSIEQLAGDLLPEPTLAQRVATGFHRNTMLNEEGGIDPLEFRFHALTDRVATTAATWLGSTMGCAQCHTHKYDPLTHTEYYQFFALLNNADEPALEVVTVESKQAALARDTQINQWITALPEKWPVPEPQSPEAARAAAEVGFQQWVLRERERTTHWQPVAPTTAESNSPLLTVLPDHSILASGDITKDDTYLLEFPSLPANVTALRLEALPDERLPAHGPGLTYYEGPLGDFFLGEFQIVRAGIPQKITSATESYSKNHFGAQPATAALAIDGNPETGWSCAGRPGEPHQAVFVIAEPLAAGPYQVRLRFGRHYACSLGRLRIAVTTDSQPSLARDLPAELEAILSQPESAWTVEHRTALREHFLLNAKELEVAVKPIRDLQRQPAGQQTLVMSERPANHPRPTHRHHRGEYLQPKEVVAAGLPSAFAAERAGAVNNRLEFARWLMSRDNPLTARVTVNRQWAALFGQGIVRSQADFGVQGDAPTHPELLDWLAIELMDRGWSLKSLHRLLVTSAVYRQSSQVRPEVLQRDPQNRWLARAPRFRLEAELVRDVVLAAAGLLSDKRFGAPVRPAQPVGVTEVVYGGNSWEVSPGEDRYRRGVYTFIKRTAPFALFNTFDGPSGEVCVVQRESSNTPLQSLTLLNDQVILEAARQLGQLLANGPGDDAAKLQTLYRRTLTRPPQLAELSRLQTFLQQHRTSPPDPTQEANLWMLVARAVFNLDEMITR